MTRFAWSCLLYFLTNIVKIVHYWNAVCNLCQLSTKTFLSSSFSHSQYISTSIFYLLVFLEKNFFTFLFDSNKYFLLLILNFSLILILILCLRYSFHISFSYFFNNNFYIPQKHFLIILLLFVSLE